ncbi:MAG: hypothetical protein NTY12_02460 [Candidatus Falkowbacteria bacterium]|nr:hypothetical protein [Candidatus Falkowbacteria bacterium]
MTKGVLYLYIKDVLFDSIKYYSYHGGMFRPPVYACITNGTYILSIKSRVDNMYNQGEANWYLMKNDGSDAFKIPKVLSLNGAGLYEANYVNICNVKPGPTMLIFYGFYYCDRETYVTYNIPDGFKNYHRRRETGCESPWKWITQ